MTSYTNVFGGSPVQPSDVSYRAISLTANTTLQWPFSFQDTADVTARIMDVTPTVNTDPLVTLTLPDATEASLGEDFLISNIDGGNQYSFQLLDSNSNVLIDTFAQGSVYYLYLVDNEEAANPAWRVTIFGQGSTVVTSVGLTTTTTTALTITDTPVTGAGTINIDASTDLVALSGFGTGDNSTGYAVRTSDTPTWALRTFTTSTANSNIVIQNPDGVSGNTDISLSTTPTGLTSLGVGNLSLSGTTLLSSSSISLTPATGSNVYINTTTSTTYIGTNGMTGGGTTIYTPNSGYAQFSSAGCYLEAPNGEIRLRGGSSSASYIDIVASTGGITISAVGGNLLLSSNTGINFNGSTLSNIASLTATTITNAQVLKAASYFSGTSTAGGVTLLSQYNIASITRSTSTGTYVVIFSNALTTNNYTVVFGNYNAGGFPFYTCTLNTASLTTTGFTFYMYAIASDGTPTYSDAGYASFNVFLPS